LRRACACGTHTPLGGECESCKKKKVQPKFAIGAANDVFEQEADAVAARIVGGERAAPEAAAPLSIQRAPESASTGVDAPVGVEGVLARSGAPLAPALRNDMEARFGHDFSQVRTHTDAEAAASADAIGASAYSAGSHVVFGAGRFAPDTAPGRFLLAHELTHVVQQTPGVLRRQPKKTPPKAPAKTAPAGPPKAASGPASASPKLAFHPAKNKPPCACIVFIHHDEKNARLVARHMYENCKYNLAIVEPAGSRDINLPQHGVIDPNELFPRDVAEACWQDDKPCTDFMAANAAKTDAKIVKAYAERQFFLAIKNCSAGFSLPIIGLHNNTIDDTASYRKDIAKAGGPATSAIEGKTFDKNLKAGDKAPANTLPYDELKTWAKKLSGVTDAAGGKLTGGPYQKNKTNIFIWCGANDNTKCQIGDPEHPDNVVWVTNEADFDKLRGKKVNVALQTRVDPAGNSKTDLSSLFIFLAEIVNSHHDVIKARYEQLQDRDAKIVADAVEKILRGEPFDGIEMTVALLMLGVRTNDVSEAQRKKRLAELRFVNIETPKVSDIAGMNAEDFRVKSLTNVRDTLAALGLDCCDTTAAPGQTESPAQKLEKAVRGGKLPEDTA